MKLLCCAILLLATALCSSAEETNPDAALRAIVYLRGPSTAGSAPEHLKESLFEQADTTEESESHESSSEDAGDTDRQELGFSAVQVEQSAMPADAGSVSAPGDEPCSCAFAGRCATKSSCLTMALTFVVASIVCIIFLAWLVQWIIAIPSEWVLAKHVSMRRSPLSAGAKQPPEAGDETRGLLARQAEASKDTEAEQEREERERARRAGPSGVPPPSPSESGRL